MSWGAIAILIIFGAFVVLLIVSPNMSCFGKRIRSPFYPLRRKRAAKNGLREDLKKKMTDYKFDLGAGSPRPPAAPGEKKPGQAPGGKKSPDKKTEDYGFRLH
ncbi:MAG TPA: hypothetical protein VMS75_04260 [Terriglobales bacterium]|nr:hypothetical protein [Terriglobales bacterium]